MKNKKTFRDFILIVSLLLIALILVFIQKTTQKTGAWAVVKVNSEEQQRFSLDKDGTYLLNGGSNILVIEDKSARLLDANCPDRLCVKQGRIKYKGQCITCLPNKLTVTIDGTEDAVDLVI